MEDALELGNYLPRAFKTPKEQEYIEFLWDGQGKTMTARHGSDLILWARH